MTPYRKSIGGMEEVDLSYLALVYRYGTAFETSTAIHVDMPKYRTGIV